MKIHGLIPLACLVLLTISGGCASTTAPDPVSNITSTIPSPNYTDVDKNELAVLEKLFATRVQDVAQRSDIDRVEVVNYVGLDEVLKTSTDPELITRWIAWLQGVRVSALPAFSWYSSSYSLTFYAGEIPYYIGSFSEPYLYVSGDRTFLHIDEYDGKEYNQLLVDMQFDLTALSG